MRLRCNHPNQVVITIRPSSTELQVDGEVVEPPNSNCLVSVLIG